MPKKPTVINRKKSRAYFVLSQMPPLNRDQVSAWLLGRPELWDWIFEKARAMDVIRYENGIWVGVNHDAASGVTQAQAQAHSNCHADIDGECSWQHCPQLRDGEPKKSGRSCPLPNDAPL